MPGSYKHIKQYEKEITEMFEQGKSLKEIGVKSGFTHKQMQDFKTFN